MRNYQEKLIDLMLISKALLFGEFTLKSGRKSPYFVNTGKFSSGYALSALGSFYAEHIVTLGLHHCDAIFGPAYKDIPLATSTAIALSRDHRCDMEVPFNREESKDHGEGGSLMGKQLQDGNKVIMIDDVITVGPTVKETVPLLKLRADASIEGLIVLVDRCERGKGELSAVQEVKEDYGLNVYPLITLHDIVEYLSDGCSLMTLSTEQKDQIFDYLQEYGVSDSDKEGDTCFLPPRGI
ncbi:MAG: orotate phosphoribosyltransferase [Deltaproteobacteria bacterium]|nr:orotate phosphoribosyltransferase [Deltaproteobacteria bacterium]